MDFGKIKNKCLEVLGVTVLKNQKYSLFFWLSPFFISVTLPEQQNPQNLRAKEIGTLLANKKATPFAEAG